MANRNDSTQTWNSTLHSEDATYHKTLEAPLSALDASKEELDLHTDYALPEGTQVPTREHHKPHTWVLPGSKPSPRAIQWAQRNYDMFEPFNVSGEGAGRILLPERVNNGIVKLTRTGVGAFTVLAYDESGEPNGEALVNSVGTYSGTTMFGVYGFGEVESLEIRGTGHWSATISPVSSIDTLPISGEGDGVYLYEGDDVTFEARHFGLSVFNIVQQYDDGLGMELLVEGFGNLIEESELVAGPSLVIINADRWKLSSVEPQ